MKFCYNCEDIFRQHGEENYIYCPYCGDELTEKDYKEWLKEVEEGKKIFLEEMEKRKILFKYKTNKEIEIYDVSVFQKTDNEITLEGISLSKEDLPFKNINKNSIVHLLYKTIYDFYFPVKIISKEEIPNVDGSYNFCIKLKELKRKK